MAVSALRKNVWGIIAIGLLIAAVVQELRKPRDERHWTGKVAWFVPYDLRPPTVDRFRTAMWSPDDPRILMPHAFGVGWTVNAGRLVRLLGRPLTSSNGQEAPAVEPAD